MRRFEVLPVPAGEGWLMVTEDGDHIAAMFRPEYAQEALEFAERLNVRALAMTCPACGRVADQVKRESGEPAVFVHNGRQGAEVRHQDLLGLLTIDTPQNGG